MIAKKRLLKTLPLIYIMSLIYTERQYRHIFPSQFIEGKKGTIIFIKKYHKYETFLNFMPNVLKDIIMTYINDTINVNYSMTFKYSFWYFNYNVTMTINYINMDHQDYIAYNNIQYITNTWYELANMYMKQYYDRNNYFPECTTYHKLNTNRCNNKSKQFKYEIIIAKKIINLISKKMIN